MNKKQAKSSDSTELKKKEAEFHSKFAKDYDKRGRLVARCPPPNKELKRHLCSLLPKGSVIIEAGCGTGLNGQYLLEMGHQYIGLDISKGMLVQARNKLSQRGDTDFVLGDAEHLPFKDECADVCLGVGILHHLPNAQLCVKEYARCSKSLVVIGGEPTRVSQFLLLPGIKLVKWLGLSPGQSPADSLTKGFTMGDISRMVEEAGLELIEIKPVALINGLVHFLKIGPWLPGFFDNFLNWIDGLLGRLPILNLFAFHWNVYCRKRDG